MSSARGAVRLLAGVELRRSIWALIALALFAGSVGAVVIGAAALARRTSSAFDRLADATNLEDARLTAFGPGPVAVDDIEALPGVEESWQSTISVARIEGERVIYLGVISGSAAPDGLITPVVLEGSMPSRDASDEVALIESVADELGLSPGDIVPVTMLTSAEVGQFAEGFGEPDGPAIDLRVTGIVRVVPGEITAMPVIASSAFAERYGDVVGAGTSVSLRLDDRSDAVTQLAAELDRRNASDELVGDAAEFLPFDLALPESGRQQVSAAARVLVAGIVAFGAVAGVAGLLVLGQAFVRREAAGAHAQSIESALGLTVTDRVAVRVLPALPAALLAGVVAAAGGMVAGTLEPIGSLVSVEPTPGWRFDSLVVVAGAIATAVSFVALAGLAAWRAGRSARGGAAGGAVVRRGGGAGRPAVAAGLSLALASGRGARAAPVRTAVMSTAVGVAGLVGAITFTASLDALEDESTRWGWPGAVSVVDVTPEMEAELAVDPRVESAGIVDASTLVIGGRGVPAVSLTTLKGEPDWTVLQGRLPERDDEVAVGTRLARDIDADVGDDLVALTPAGDEVSMQVVGVALAPPSDDSALGDDVIVSAGARRALGQSEPFREAVVAVGPEVDAGSMVDEWSSRWEVFAAEPPAEVRNLAGLGSLPMLLGVFLAAVGLFALANALVITVRRRGGDFAVLRTLGFTDGQLRGSVVGMALTTATIGLVVGLPLGLAVGRLTWWVAATDAGVSPTFEIPVAALVVSVVSVLVSAVGLSLVSGRRVARVRPSALLQSE
jgi:putative ABC transport system permease protein